MCLHLSGYVQDTHLLSSVRLNQQWLSNNCSPSSLSLSLPMVETETFTWSAVAVYYLIILGAALKKRVTCATGQTVSNEACCAWFPVLDDIQQNLFGGGQCNAEAHEAIRL